MFWAFHAYRESFWKQLSLRNFKVPTKTVDWEKQALMWVMSTDESKVELTNTCGVSLTMFFNIKSAIQSSFNVKPIIINKCHAANI